MFNLTINAQTTQSQRIGTMTHVALFCLYTAKRRSGGVYQGWVTG